MSSSTSRSERAQGAEGIFDDFNVFFGKPAPGSEYCNAGTNLGWWRSHSARRCGRGQTFRSGVRVGCLREWRISLRVRLQQVQLTAGKLLLQASMTASVS